MGNLRISCPYDYKIYIIKYNTVRCWLLITHCLEDLFVELRVEGSTSLVAR